MWIYLILEMVDEEGGNARSSLPHPIYVDDILICMPSISVVLLSNGETALTHERVCTVSPIHCMDDICDVRADQVQIFDGMCSSVKGG